MILVRLLLNDYPTIRKRVVGIPVTHLVTFYFLTLKTFIMIKFITSVDTSKAGKLYASDNKGNAMFGRTPAITEKLKAGAYANVVEQLQTKGYDADGKLVDLPVEEQRRNLIITAVFPDKATAIMHNAEESLFEVETAAFVKAQTHKIAATYKVEGSLADAI